MQMIKTIWLAAPGCYLIFFIPSPAVSIVGFAQSSVKTLFCKFSSPNYQKIDKILRVGRVLLLKLILKVGYTNRKM